MTSRPILVTPLVATLFVAPPVLTCALVTAVVLWRPQSPPAATTIQAPVPNIMAATEVPAPTPDMTAAPALPAPLPDPTAAAAAPTPELEPTVVVVTRYGEFLNKLETDNSACRAIGQNSVDNAANAQPADPDTTPGSASVVTSLQARYNAAYSQCMVSRGYKIQGQGKPTVKARAGNPRPPRMMPNSVPRPPAFSVPQPPPGMPGPPLPPPPFLMP